MNNKYAIGTVVGAALLGLAKSSLLGSSARLFLHHKLKMDFQIAFADYYTNQQFDFRDKFSSYIVQNLYKLLGIEEGDLIFTSKQSSVRYESSLSSCSFEVSSISIDFSITSTRLLELDSTKLKKFLTDFIDRYYDRPAEIYETENLRLGLDRRYMIKTARITFDETVIPSETIRKR